MFYFKYPKLHSLIFKQNAENYIFPLKTWTSEPSMVAVAMFSWIIDKRKGERHMVWLMITPTKANLNLFVVGSTDRILYKINSSFRAIYGCYCNASLASSSHIFTTKYNSVWFFKIVLNIIFALVANNILAQFIKEESKEI